MSIVPVLILPFVIVINKGNRSADFGRVAIKSIDKA
jgi:hypothetical protein